jgi:hypothetical protein
VSRLDARLQKLELLADERAEAERSALAARATSPNGIPAEVVETAERVLREARSSGWGWACAVRLAEEVWHLMTRQEGADWMKWDGPPRGNATWQDVERHYAHLDAPAAPAPTTRKTFRPRRRRC